MSSNLHPMLNVAIKAARAAGAIINRAALDVEAVRVAQKQVNDFVTEVDQAAEQTIIETLLTAYPGHGILAEESGRTHGSQHSDYVWIIDPLDGTTNFLHGMPHWAVSIALEKDGEVIAGVVYDPIKDEIFYAEKGTGAFMTGRRLRVSSRSDLTESLIAVGGARVGARHYQQYMAEIDAIMSHVPGTRRYGAASLDICYVAAGRFDGFWERELNAWDVAAAALIVKEAGGYVSDLKGGKDYVYGRSLVTGNPDIHAALLKRLKAVAPKDDKKAQTAT
jgi:myo-inositol-1(or 4)-monophosphatase